MVAARAGPRVAGMPAAPAPAPDADGAGAPSGGTGAVPVLPPAPPLALPGAVEAALVRQRRLRAGVPDDAPTVGLALSGGGVRSATFGLGLLRGLAQRGQLKRIDYLSTVSGGGYIGAMFGRLAALVGIDAAERLLAANDSPVLAWLRRNGRYLTPAGSHDVATAAVTYLRAFLAIHGEFAAVSLPFALGVIAPHLLHTIAVLQEDGVGAASAHAWQPWHTLWWPLALLGWFALAPGLMSGYWVARDSPDPGQRHAPVPWRDVAFVGLLCLALGAVWLVAAPPLPGATAPLTASALALVALSSSALGLVAAHARLLLTDETRSLAVARLRHGATAALRVVTLAAVVGLVLGAIDRLSWWLLVELQSGARWVWGGIGLGGAAVLVLRTLAQPMLQLSQQPQTGMRATLGPRLLNLAGLVGFAVLLTAWVVAVQWIVFTPEPLGGFDQFTPGLRAGLLLATSLVWLLLTAANAQMANASSLHTFYRARLARAYLAVGNPDRRLADARAPADPRGRDDVTAVVPGDDTGLRSYRPELAGGPIHLINACLNQTRDDASGLYNADRKGTLVTATARGFELGVRGWFPMAEDADAGTLGRWIAVSGAAAAPGAGAYTSRGWALLLYFLGVRLGYWMRAPRGAARGDAGVLAPPPAAAMGETAETRAEARAAAAVDARRVPRLRRQRLARWLWRYAIKPVMLWSEGTATYFGAARPWWYLSDGGHFENTGVYPLLKRRVDFIVAADCGADHDYDYADLENLVRKARIDLGCEIEFYSRDEAARLFTLRGTELTVLSPEAMGDVHSARGVLLARVRYPAAAGHPAREATLLVIKPNLHDALDVDLLAYAQRHPRFPHESTGDQSFDEAQWESYHRLGEDFGRALHEPWLRQLPGWTRREHHPLAVAARLRGEAARPDPPGTVPWWRRGVPATALGASLGLGASGTLLLSLWQLQDQLDTRRNEARAEVRRLFAETSGEVRQLDAACPRLADHTATQVLMLHDLRQSPVLLPIEQDGVGALLSRLGEACGQPPSAEPGCAEAARRLAGGLCITLRKRELGDRVLAYWAPVPAGHGAAQWLAAWRAGFRTPQQAMAAGSAAVVARTASAAAGVGAGRGTAPGGGSAAGPAGAGPGSPGAGSAASGGAPSNPAAAAIAAACAARGGDGAVAPLQLYTQVYDESSRQAARPLRRALQSAAGDALQVAPVEDVTRSATLRGTRRPVPWPQPTFVLHAAADRACAEALRPLVQAAWTPPGRAPVEVWFRRLPSDRSAQERVMELWLPRREPAREAGGFD